MASAVAPLFHIERALALVSLSLLWPTYVSQLLAWRFTPRRRWARTKIGVICIGFTALLVESCRVPDLSSGFGLIPVFVQRLGYEQLGALFLSALVLVMVASARTLFVQMGYTKVPRVFLAFLWGAAGVNQLALVPGAIGGSLAYARDDRTALQDWWAAMTLEFLLVAAVVLGTHWALFLNLRRHVTAFLATLEAQKVQEKEWIALAPSPPLSTATSTPLSVSPSFMLVVAASSTPSLEADDPLAAGAAFQSLLPSPSPLRSPSHAHVRSPSVMPHDKPMFMHTPSSVQRSSSMQVAQSPLVAGSPPSQSDMRLRELHAALTKLNRLTVAVTIVLCGGACTQFSDLRAYFRGETIPAIVRSYVSPGEPFPPFNLLITVLHHCCFWICLWYAYTPTHAWKSAVRRELGIPFWRTLIHGLDEVAYEAAAERLRGSGGGGVVPTPLQLRRLPTRSLDAATATPSTPNGSGAPAVTPTTLLPPLVVGASPTETPTGSATNTLAPRQAAWVPGTHSISEQGPPVEA